MSVAVKATGQQAPFVIVGGGRVGEALANMGGNIDTIVRRGEKVPHGEAGTPIIVCTRNDDLASVVQVTPENRRKDLTFIQNGMLQPWLDEQGLGDNTQVLVYFAVAKKGEAPIDGKTDVNPEGLTAACGEHAEAVAHRLRAGGLSCKVLDRVTFKQAMLEKLVWISGIMLLGAKHGGNVGDVESKHTQQACSLISELAEGGARELDIALAPGAVERLLAYSRSVAHFPTAIKEFPWRNGWFYSITQREVGDGRPDPFPQHTQLLKEVKAI